MSTDRTDVLFPPGRLVSGSVKEARNTDNQGNPLTVKSGNNAGQPRVEYSFGVAIPKAGEAHWNQTPWGAQIWHAAAAAWPGRQYENPAFSWKIQDGDSTVPNTAGNANANREGYPGNWIVYFSSGIQPKTVNRDGSAPVDPTTIERGYFVEVFGNVAGNANTQKPGIYINHQIVALNAYGDIIASGPDAASVGFGGAAAPAGAMATPPAGMSQPAQTGAAAPPPPPPPAQQQAPAAAATPPPPPPPAQTGAVQPDHSFVQNAAAAAPPPQAPPERRFTVQGQVYTESQLQTWGWSPEQINAQQPA